MGPEEDLVKVFQEISQCKNCALYHSRKYAVPGEGPTQAAIMFVGEGPGFHENEQGRPFVGAAGKFLDDLLAMVKMKRAEVYITNVVKCRPPGNRDPQPDELTSCSGYLERQIRIINPEIIITLGRYSLAHFLPRSKISDVHGQAINIKGRLMIAMYHPAAALHQQSLRTTIEQDFLRIPEIIAHASRISPEAETELKDKGEPKQLSLF